MVAIDQFLEEFCSLNELSVFRTSFSLFTDIHLIFGTLICHTKIQIKSKFSFDSLIFGLQKLSRIISFPLLTDIHLIVGTLLSHTKIHIKFEFGFDPLIFPNAMT
jgi:hypothetical protein